ncbi:PREDICTED: serine/threonine-rich protein adg2 [Dinoponera quadriceps]|uniref:Serine/threonine-rich protein adg2 n=1 Tax=Dinoponera quadriceps TaxID=609295 RepID=A0A6P3Y7M3_DINQU|nr:PREDICTED: serine/threonine-rich protein adg2 [Dinoponera quadriceps]
MDKPLHWIVILQLSSAFAYTQDPWYRGDTKRPVDVITDVVNDLGVKILQQYSNHGNVAFSPTGVAFVLAALYEGSAGRGSQQILDAMGLPANRDVTRIGFRDIHRRLRSYLNADGFLGGLTLSRENTRLRPEYEDVLRFYGFDLSSIEQEANVTVSVEDASTEPSTSTVDLTSLPVETTTGRSATDTTTATTTMLTTDAAATPALASAAAETTTVPSTATAAATQQTVTIPLTADVPTTPAPIPGAVSQNTPTQPANSLTTVTSDESAQPPPTGAENVTPNTTPTNTGQASTPSTDSQASSSTVIMIVLAGNQSTQMPTVAGDTATNESAGSTESDIGSMNSNVPTTTIQTPSGEFGTTMPTTSRDTEVPSTEMPVATTSTEQPMASTTNATVTTGEISNTATLNSPAPMTPITPDTANVTIPNPGAMTDNSIVPSTEPSTTTSTPAGDDASGTTAAIDLMTMTSADGGTTPPVSPEGPEATTMVSPPVPVNGTSGDPAVNSNSSTVASTAASIDNQTVASPLVDENTVAISRKKKSIGSGVTGSKMRDATDDNTVKGESTDDKPADRRVRRTRNPRGYFSSYPDEGIWMQDLDIWKSYSTLSPRESAEDSTSEIAFLVNGCDVYSVSGSRYIAVLPFAYFPSLHAVALEFPLDDPRYNIILLMPTDRTDTHRLARDLSGKSLRSLRKRLQPTWVRATIPSFMLRGFVTLTSFLQRLGISDVFEPRVADLSPMTADLGVYARDVQQSIGVNIRNYMKPDRTHSRNGLFERAGPVPFTVMHPFLYFIVDTETSVSLIAGRVDDPLNSRIL